AALHGFVPEGWIAAHLGGQQWWSVPAAVLLGIPLYSNATGIIPVMESLLSNGLPIGTTLAFCMSTVAASFPEFILLKQVMQWRLLAILFAMLLVAFTLVGWIFNIFTPLL
ncbi:MAG TPA: permease, partial [Psychromonas sp.]